MANEASVQITTPETGAEAPAAAAAAPAIPDKFKNADGSVNTDALLASYAELEKKQSAPAAAKTGEENADPNAAKEAQPAAAAEKAEVTEEEKSVTAVLKAAGLELTPFNDEFAKDGKLSDASYAALEAKGFSRDAVDTYIRGVQASQADAAALVSDIKAAAGGDDGYSQMIDWAKGTLDAKQIAEFNEAVSSGKPGIAKAAVQALKAQFDNAEGREPTLIGGNSKVTGEVFRSWAEMNTAMSDPRYGKDPAYTRDIEQKAVRSNIK